MKIIKILCACLLLALMTGCGADSSDGTQQIEKMTLEELRENKSQEADKVKNSELENLTFDQIGDFRVPQELGRYKVMIIDHFEDQADEIFRKYAPEDVYQKGTVTDGEGYYPIGPDFDESESELHIGIGCIGFFNYSCKSKSTLAAVDECENPKECFLLTEKEKIDAQETEDMKITKEILTQAGSFADDFCTSTSFPVALEPYMVGVYKEGENGNVYRANLRFLFKDIPVNYMQCEIPGKEDQEMPYFIAATSLFDQELELKYFCVQCGFEEAAVLETYQELISPSQAAILLSEKLSGYTRYNVKGMELVYCPMKRDEVDHKEENEKHRSEAGWAIACSYDEWELIPCWAFYFSTDSQKERYGLVDVKTGEAVYIEN